MFNNRTPDPQPAPTDDQPALLARLAALEAAVRAKGVPVPGAKCMTVPTTFASRRAGAEPVQPPPLVSMGTSTKIIETIERGHHGERRVELEYFTEKGHGNRVWAREPGGPLFPVSRAR